MHDARLDLQVMLKYVEGCRAAAKRHWDVSLEVYLKKRILILTSCKAAHL